ncbi:MAG TPA: hypothetical protein VFF43_23265, partial [Caldimonas sp.]|nr:hypothetical protein [Caldimonas sp.]
MPRTDPEADAVDEALAKLRAVAVALDDADAAAALSALSRRLGGKSPVDEGRRRFTLQTFQTRILEAIANGV